MKPRDLLDPETNARLSELEAKFNSNVDLTKEEIAEVVKIGRLVAEKAGGMPLDVQMAVAMLENLP